MFQNDVVQHIAIFYWVFIAINEILFEKNLKVCYNVVECFKKFGDTI